MRLMFLTGSRGEWGYIRPVIEEAVNRGHDYIITVTNMHLSASHGHTESYIEADDYVASYRILMDKHDTREDHASALGGFLKKFNGVLNTEQPDWLILAGDRGEQLMGAIAGAYSYIPTAHIQAGERSGNIDNSARMAIAKLAHLHFCANDDAAIRLAHMGEEPWRIKVTGAPQLDDIKPGSPRPMDQEYILVVMHPTTDESTEADKQAAILAEALRNTDKKVIWIHPNNDPGWKDVAKHLKGYTSYTNLPRQEYLQLLEHAYCIVGNSSSGLLEAPIFGTPCINIGHRQRDRIRGSNVLDVSDWDPLIIKHVIDGCHQFRKTSNPYGASNSSKVIITCLEEAAQSANLTDKRMEY